MSGEQPVPRWLWNFANGALVTVVLGLAILVWALARALVDSPHASTLWLFDDFKGPTSRWTFIASDEASLQTISGALVATLTDAPEQMVFGLTERPSTDFSLEIAGTPMANSNAIAYGLVFNWQDATHYSVVLVNGNGYAEAYRRVGADRIAWFKWQQWPHAFSGDNRVRVDVRAGHIIVRVNDEWLVEADGVESSGKIGVAARGAGTPGGVVFSWVKVWLEP